MAVAWGLLGSWLWVSGAADSAGLGWEQLEHHAGQVGSGPHRCGPSRTIVLAGVWGSCCPAHWLLLPQGHGPWVPQSFSPELDAVHDCDFALSLRDTDAAPQGLVLWRSWAGMWDVQGSALRGLGSPFPSPTQAAWLPSQRPHCSLGDLSTMGHVCESEHACMHLRTGHTHVCTCVGVCVYVHAYRELVPGSYMIMCVCMCGVHTCMCVCVPCVHVQVCMCAMCPCICVYVCIRCVCVCRVCLRICAHA